MKIVNIVNRFIDRLFDSEKGSFVFVIIIAGMITAIYYLNYRDFTLP